MWTGVLGLGIGLALMWMWSKPVKKPIQNQDVLIIGASKGIGKELALQLAKRKCRLIIAARNTAELEQVISQLAKIDNLREVHSIKCDWTIESDLDKLLEFTKSKFGHLDCLILCAGVLSTTPFKELSETSEFKSVLRGMFDINTMGPIMATKFFLPLLTESRGLIVVLSSSAGVMAAPTRSLYCATKFAVTGFFRALRIELRSTGVDVCLVMPGSVDTGLRSSALDAAYSTQTKDSKGMSPQKCARLILEAADERKMEVFMPSHYQIGAILTNILPSLVDYLAIRKYSK